MWNQEILDKINKLYEFSGVENTHHIDTKIEEQKFIGAYDALENEIDNLILLQLSEEFPFHHYDDIDKAYYEVTTGGIFELDCSYELISKLVLEELEKGVESDEIKETLEQKVEKEFLEYKNRILRYEPREIFKKSYKTAIFSWIRKTINQTHIPQETYDILNSYHDPINTIYQEILNWDGNPNHDELMFIIENLEIYQ